MLGTLFLGAHGVPPIVASGSCYITTQLKCAEIWINESVISVSFYNSEGTNLLLPSNSFRVAISGSREMYTGSCVATKGNTDTNMSIYSNYAQSEYKIVCSADIGSAGLSNGTNLAPEFAVGYELCQNRGSCQQELNTTGTGTLRIT